MGKMLKIYLLLFAMPFLCFSQSIKFDADTLFKSGTPDSLLFMFYAKIVNLTSHTMNIQVIRTQNELPSEWSSSLCLYPSCFPPGVDTVEALLLPDSTVLFDLNVSTSPTFPGEAVVSIRVQRKDNPTDGVERTFTTTTIPTSVARKKFPVTGDFQLHQNYPNPFNPETHIAFEIGGFSAVKTQLVIYNILGQEVANLFERNLPPGFYEVIWDGKDRYGRTVSSGMYFYELKAGRQHLLGKMIILR